MKQLLFAATLCAALGIAAFAAQTQTPPAQTPPAQPAQGVPESRPLWNALHFPRAFGPANCWCGEEEPRVAVLWRAASFAAGTFRVGVGYGIKSAGGRPIWPDRSLSPFWQPA